MTPAKRVNIVKCFERRRGMGSSRPAPLKVEAVRFPTISYDLNLLSHRTKLRNEDLVVERVNPRILVALNEQIGHRIRSIFARVSF